MGLCEMRWKNFGEMSTDNGHKVYFSGEEGKHEYGVGFLVHKDVVGAVLGCQPVSSRLISIRLRAAPFNITIIQVFAPTSGHDDSEVDHFYQTVQMNGSIGEWFRTTVGVRQGCLLSPTLFNIFLEWIMSDALEEHDGKVSIGGRNITNLRFADGIDALAEEQQELEALVESLDKTCTRYKMEVSAEKTKLMTNSVNGIQREIKVKGQKLGTVTSFKYLGAVISDDGSKPEVLSRIAQATAALTKMKPIWRDNNISLGSKVKLMRSLVISIFLYACESWTLTAELEKRTQAFEMRGYRRLLNISYKDHVTNEEVRKKIQAAIGEYDELLTLVKKRKLRWFGHVSRSSGLAKTILQGTVKGKRKRDKQKKRWEDNIKKWTGMDLASSTRAAENRSKWKGIVANSSVVPRRPSKVMG